MAGLKATLARLVSSARVNKDKPVRTRLAKGLSVALKFEGEVLAVQLARANVYPSTLEWKTVLNSLPRNTVAEGPKPLTAGSVFYLKGKVRLAEELIQ